MKKKDLEKNVIYVLLSHTTKTFMIFLGHKNSLRETYRHHLALHRLYSERFIRSLSPERPCIFILEEIDFEEEVNLLLVWLKIMQDHGYVSCNHPEIIEQSEHLHIDEMVAYEKRMHFDLSTILTCEKCLVPTYKREPCSHYLPSKNDLDHTSNSLLPCNPKKKKTKEIRFVVSENEHQAILEQAKRLGMNTNAYIRRATTSPIIRHYNYDAIRDHTKEIGEIRNCINRLIFTIEATNNYLPRDISTIVNLMREIFKSENELIEMLRKQRNHQD